MPEKRLKIYGELYLELSKVFEPFNIDLIFLEETSPLLQYEAIKEYRFYEDNTEWAEEYEEKITKIASDLLIKRRMVEGDFIETLGGGL
jgi:hypothetical protein